MSLPPEEINDQIEAAVRRYLAKLGRRYAPIAAGVLAFVLVVTLVPTVDRTQPNAGTGPFPQGSVPGDPFTPGGVTPTGLPSGTTFFFPGGGGGAPLPPGVTPPAPPGSSGVARSGVRCGPGALQVTWTVYAPYCQPAYSGNNGGATSRGVSAKEIVITYRKVVAAQDAALRAAVGDAYPAPDDVFLADMQTYIDLFNKHYELYGRKVVLRPFNGQGDFLVEDQGQGQEQAYADAATAADQVRAFADVTLNVKGSQPYWTGLYREKVIAIGPLGFPDSYYERYSPYWWSVYPTGSRGADIVVNTTCRRLKGLDAIFAGDAALRSNKRVFGLITPENPEYVEIGNAIVARLKSCGVSIERYEKYTINVATFQTQSTNMMAQMSTRNVSTIICYCDPVVPVFLSQAADQQRYHPEWYEPWYRDPQARQPSQTQWNHAISNGVTWPAKNRSEAYTAFKLAAPNSEPREQYYEVAYGTVLFLFNAIQAAGPYLTPVTFGQGAFSLPKSAPGLYGTWAGRTNEFTPAIDTTLAWWNPAATSNYDGRQGAWISCENGALMPFDDPNKWGPAGTQLHCFGR